ncbi:hypothetical protein GCM10028809_13830 [Spirosoma gilvum]
MRVRQDRPFAKWPVGVSVNNQPTIIQSVRVPKHNAVEPHGQKQAKQYSGDVQPMYVEPIKH